jgi:hypothetical protein
MYTFIFTIKEETLYHVVKKHSHNIKSRI